MSSPRVTDADMWDDQQINSRNNPEGSLEEIEARMYKLMGKEPPDRNDPAEIARRKANIGRWHAERDGGMCSTCLRELAADEPVYIDVVWEGYRAFTGTFGRRYGPVCGDCTHEGLREIKPGTHYWRYGNWVSVHVNEPCDTCGRHVVFKESSLQYRNRRHIFCCERCQWTYHNNIRNQRNAAAREKTCEVCGKEFTATRKDTKTCSSPCRQKAYRQRLKDATR